MSEEHNLGHFFIPFFSFIILGQLDLVSYSLECLTFACTLEAQSSRYALFHNNKIFEKTCQPHNNTIQFLNGKDLVQIVDKKSIEYISKA